MTLPLARRVRELRLENSWSGVSEEIFAFPEGEILLDWLDMKGHQPLGMYLCSAAAAALGENDEEEPWN
jgi:hypothetical protein